MSNKVEFSLGLVDNISSSISKIKSNFNDNFSSMQKSVKSLSNEIKGANVALGALGSFVTIKKIIDAKTEIDNLKISLNSAFGSEVGGGLFKELKSIQENTAIGQKPFLEAAVAMKGLGVETSKITPLLGNLADIAGSNEGAFNTLATAIGKVSVNGSLGTRELMALRSAGFDPLRIISQKTGESIENLNERLKEGKISFKEIEGVLKTVTSEGGQFYGISQKLSQTIGGRLSSVLSKFGDILAMIGDAMEPKFNSILNFFEKLTSTIVKNKDVISKIAPIFLNFVGIIGGATLAVKALNLVMSLNPFVAIGIAVAALSAYLIEAINWSEKLQVIYNDFSLGNFSEAIKNIGRLITEVLVKGLLKVAEIFVNLLPDSFATGIKKTIANAKGYLAYYGGGSSGTSNYTSPAEQFTAAPIYGGASKTLADDEMNAKNAVSSGGIKIFNVNIGELVGIKANSVNTGEDAAENAGKMISNVLMREMSQFSF